MTQRKNALITDGSDYGSTAFRHLVAAWGVLGVAGFISTAIVRLSPKAIAVVQTGMSGFEWTLFVLSVVLMAHSEGYRGFQKAFSPRVVVRAYGAADRGWLSKLGAPLVAMGLFNATRKRLTVAWCMVLGIAGLVLLVRLLDQPWRGIVDAGVVVGLGWGIIAILVFWVRALRGVLPDYPADFPETEPWSPGPS